MKNILKGLGWAIAMIDIAWAGHVGALSEDLTRTLLVIIPVLAVMSLSDGGKSCLPRREA